MFESPGSMRWYVGQLVLSVVGVTISTDQDTPDLVVGEHTLGHGDLLDAEGSLSLSTLDRRPWKHH